MTTVITIGDDIPFDANVWIGQKKKWHNDIPWEVIREKNRVLTPPPAQAAEILPPSSLAISSFAHLPLPRISSILVHAESPLWFSNEEPTCDVARLADRTVPHKMLLDMLSRKIGQAWLNGARSITDPRYNEGNERLLLYTLTLWQRLAEVHGIQVQWKRGMDWLEKEKDHFNTGPAHKEIQDALASMTRVGWAVPLSFIQNTTTTADLKEFVSSVWLRTTNMDIMMESLRVRVEADVDDEKACKSIVAPMSFVKDVVKGDKEGYLRRTVPLLARYEKLVSEGKKDRLVFITNVSDEHWVAGCIDFKGHKILFGDSMPENLRYPISKKLLQGLQHWVQRRFESTFSVEADGLTHGTQLDAVSCGVVAVNTCERAIYPDTAVWKGKHAVLYRVQHFNKYIADVKAADLLPPSIPLARPIAPNSIPSSLYAVDASRSPQAARISISQLLNPEPLRSERPASLLTVSTVSAQDWTDVDILLGRNTASDYESDVEMEDAEEDEEDESDDMEGEKIKQGLSNRDVSSTFNATTSSPMHSRQTTLASFFSGVKQKEPETRPPLPTFRPKKKLKTHTIPIPTPHTPGKSHTSKWAQKIKQQFMDQKFVVEPEKYDKWKQEIRKLDPLAEFHPKPESMMTWENFRTVRHARCGTHVLLKRPYDISRYRDHLEAGCAITHKGAGMQTLFTHFSASESRSGGAATPLSQSLDARIHDEPCPGVTEVDIPHVERYLRRTGAMGGGSRSVYKIAQAQFKNTFSGLSSRKQGVVRDTQQHELRWRNDHQRLRVFSTSCQKTVPAGDIRCLPCSRCFSLLSDRDFKRALRKTGPSNPKNYIYTPKEFQNQTLGEIYGRHQGLQAIIEQPVSDKDDITACNSCGEIQDAKSTPCIRYAQGVLEGKYTNEVFNGLVEAMVSTADREERGVGMQNFKYPPAFDEFCNVMRITSPATYRVFKDHLTGRSERSFRIKEAREPRFPMDISDVNFNLVSDYLNAINYHGPVGLSCDDTKLFASFRLYWDSEKKSHFLVGGTDGPLRVADPEQVKSVIKDAKATKATKIRLWCLTVPMPGITPIVVAALPIPGDLKVGTLLEHLTKVVNGLLDRGIEVISYACDGTQVERSVQDAFVKQATETETHTIKDPRQSGRDLCIKIAVVKGQHIAMMQDPKHALKTFRNNLFSGARLLCLGSYTAIYEHIREIAFAEGSTLFHRDVEKLDRQDDNAAVRLFSADTLKYLSDHHPGYLGEIVYLFVFGELIDAYQSRSIDHAERARMVLRARYFVDSWSTFLDISGYSKTVYFLSREAVDIIRFVVEGYLSLVFIHRDHLNVLHPLLPWFHASEACEHVFGCARQIVKDFTMLDFLYMVPKLRVKMRSTVLRGKSSDSKKSAKGYSHTYFDVTGLNLRALSTFPDDLTISSIASGALEESDSLIFLLGITPVQLHSGPSPSRTVLPNIASWFTVDNDGESDIDGNGGEFSDTESVSDAQELHDLVEEAQGRLDAGPKSKRAELLDLTAAALALEADAMTQIHHVPDPSEEVVDEMLAEEQENIRTIFESINPTVIPSLEMSDDLPSKPIGKGLVTAARLDFDYLVHLRSIHQTAQAARSIKTRTIGLNDSLPTLQARSTAHRQLVRKLNAALREQQEQAVGTGAERGLRWRNSAPGGRGVGDKRKAGNSENAAATATALARAAATKRKKVFIDAKVPNLSEVIDARISMIRPLLPGQYGFVFTSQGLMVGKVFAMRAKGGGQYGKHDAVTDSSSISALSKVSVQLFEQIHGAHFRSIPTATASLQTLQFAHLPSIAFLCVISAPEATPSGLVLADSEVQRFKSLALGKAKFALALSNFNKRVRAEEEVE
ncbi:unnamed protein product [Mycena citricolor]|uniref:Ubiquitin-like protease family profile domain-containing protein n=1 Tax=Mycena citricolor TaxID=2018698 RepID=A0AAD2Q5I5_9AGAR|nr:unnamed protein product [Mycena citricolor]